jgi:hypothetical protein
MTPNPDRKTYLHRTFASAFSALDDFRAKQPHDAAEIYGAVVQHVRSSAPQALLSLDTGPIVLVPPEDNSAELEKLRAEIETMRPTFVAALEWRANHFTGHQISAKALTDAIDAVQPRTDCQCSECESYRQATP